MNDGLDLDGQRERLESHKQKSGKKMSIQNSVPERSPTCLVLGFMQIRVEGGSGQDIRQSKIGGWGWLESWPKR